MKKLDLSRYPSITMEEFLINFVFPNNSKAIDRNSGEELILNDISLLNHYDINDLDIEGVSRASFNDVTIDKLYRGEILLVRSTSWKGKGSLTIPYYRPQLVIGDLVASSMVKEHDLYEDVSLPSSYQLRRIKKKGR